MKRKGFRVNQAGYTTLEVVIASTLVCTLAVGAMTGFRQISRANQQASTRTAHTEMRARIFEALSDSNTCAASLGYPQLLNALIPGDVEVGAIHHMRLDPLAVPAIVPLYPRPVVASKEKVEGLEYTLTLKFPEPGYTSDVFRQGPGRPGDMIRHHGVLEVAGERYMLNETATRMPVIGLIPLAMEFDQATGRMSSCTLNPEEIDETLVDGVHTVRECIAADGAPYPTDLGLICRFPVRTLNVAKKAPVVSSCNDLAPGWSDVASPNYTTTLARDTQLRGCKGPVKMLTGWHYMGPWPVESVTKKIKKGAAKNFNWTAAGATFVAAGLIGLAVFVIVFLLASKCSTEPYTLYAQVNGVGCK